MPSPSPSPPVFRFAPSPNGYLHLGHARSALLNARFADERGGVFLLRIEDIDQGRSRESFISAIEEDLTWLQLAWQQPVLRQSTRFHAYRATLEQLEADRLVYPCFCSRSAITSSASGARDPDGAPLYPGTCRHISENERQQRRAVEPFALRLDMAEACKRQTALTWTRWDPQSGDQTTIPARPDLWGDAILMRKDTPTSYHLAVVIDDAFQGVSNVVRGQDLEAATHLHRLLQALLGLPSPVYHHHKLILDDTGGKLSKSAGSESLRALRAAGWAPSKVIERAMAGL